MRIRPAGIWAVYALAFVAVCSLLISLLGNILASISHKADFGVPAPMVLIGCRTSHGCTAMVRQRRRSRVKHVEASCHTL